jgi:hypothetical protein
MTLYSVNSFATIHLFSVQSLVSIYMLLSRHLPKNKKVLFTHSFSVLRDNNGGSSVPKRHDHSHYPVPLLHVKCSFRDFVNKSVSLEVFPDMEIHWPLILWPPIHTLKNDWTDYGMDIAIGGYPLIVLFNSLQHGRWTCEVGATLVPLNIGSYNGV